MKSIYISLLLIFLIIFSTAATQLLGRPNNDGWNTRKSDHFIIKYRTANAFIEDVARLAEMYYHTIEKRLELNRFDRFWTWDNRCHIIIYDTQDAYRNETGMPEWSGGCVDYEKKIIHTFPWADNFLEVLLPHEIAHIVFREYIKNNPAVPLWIDEGIAQYYERNADMRMRAILDSAERNATLISMERLMSIRSIKHEGSDPQVMLFYAQSKSIISFMIERYGQKRFAEFIRQLRQGKPVEEALRFTYTGTIDSLNALEQKWIESIRNSR